MEFRLFAIYMCMVCMCDIILIVPQTKRYACVSLPLYIWEIMIEIQMHLEISREEVTQGDTYVNKIYKQAFRYTNRLMRHCGKNIIYVYIYIYIYTSCHVFHIAIHLYAFVLMEIKCYRIHPQFISSTVRCCYNGINFLKNPHNIHPIRVGVFCDFEIWYMCS